MTTPPEPVSVPPHQDPADETASPPPDPLPDPESDTSDVHGPDDVHGSEDAGDPDEAVGSVGSVDSDDEEWVDEEPAELREVDPPAAAIGNASLLGVGYLMLGDRRAAIVVGWITAVLLLVLTVIFRSVWVEIVVVLWWAAVAVHGWRLAGGRAATPGPRARRQRLIALAAAVPVVLFVGLLRFDAAGVERDVDDARAAGDCTAAVSAVDRLWFGHRLANAPLTARGQATVEACDAIAGAERELQSSVAGGVPLLQSGFKSLTGALADHPGYERVVDHVVDRFVAKLPLTNPCDTRALTTWLRTREAQGNPLDRAAEVVPGVEPTAMLQCGDALMARESFTEARQRYQELLDVYPKHELAPKAAEGVQKAVWAIELANVRSLLGSPSGTSRYCATPAPYSAAAPYGAQNPNRAWISGTNKHTDRLPGDWKVDDVAKATVVLCAEAPRDGSVKETCNYLFNGVFSGSKDVSFHRVAIPVRLYELKTGRLITTTTVEIDGESCPAVVKYTTRSVLDTGPASDMTVTPSDADITTAFNSLINT
ncbi:hypothetical protein [Actinosynnema sp. NPDC020468]|uniref:tetratricopeptide repeat protein n=1 Tax=Actinosynnema sp. NPDC020468 TaxID=3154488 RepID=UPI0033E21C5B